MRSRAEVRLTWSENGNDLDLDSVNAARSRRDLVLSEIPLGLEHCYDPANLGDMPIMGDRGYDLL